MNKRLLIIVICVTGGVVLCAFFPVSLEILLVLNLILIFLLGISRLSLKSTDFKLPNKKANHKNPLVSIYIPCCNEPAGVVKKAIKSAYAQDYKNLEIIVLSNNTKNEQLYRPVKWMINSLNDKVRFYHMDDIKGFKAGALNMCNKLSNSSAKYIFVLNSDYVLEPQAISIAVSDIERTGVALLQYSRSYYNSDQENGVCQDFEHYNNVYAKGGNAYFSALPSGSLTMIRKSALNNVRGWPLSSITENSSLGIKLLLRGYNSLFIPNSIAKGSIPHSYEALKTQRSRWIFGNLQSLKDIFSLKGSLKTKWYMIIQLTAWMNFLGLPIVCLLLASILLLYGVDANLSSVVYISVFSIFMQALFKYVLFFKSSGGNSRQANSGFLAHLATAELGAYVWWRYFFDNAMPFIVRNKFKVRDKIEFKDLGLPLVLIFCCAILQFVGYESASAILAIFFTLYFGAKIFLFYELNYLNNKIKSSYHQNEL